MVDALVSGSLSPAVQAVIIMGVPDVASILGQPMQLIDAQGLIASLPMEVAAPLRDMVVSAEVSIAALLSAHMIIFWLSQDSNVTPPVALAAFTAAAIAKAPAMGTGMESWKLAKGLYIVPILFAYTPLLSGDWWAMLSVFCFAVVGIFSMVSGLQGCMNLVIGWPIRILSIISGIACMWPNDLVIQMVGVVMVGGLYIHNRGFVSKGVAVQ